MRYFVTVGDRTLEVEVDGSRVLVEGTDVQADLAGTGPLRHLLLDGMSHPLLVTAGETRGDWQVELGGKRHDVAVVDERTRAIRAMTGADRAGRGAPSVRAPMPGLILRIEVSAGDTVQPGQGVVIMEAMKMENELKADGGGIVAKIHVATGQAVEKGTVLVEFEAP